MTEQTPKPEKTTEEKILEVLMSIKSILQFFAFIVVITIILQACAALT